MNLTRGELGELIAMVVTSLQDQTGKPVSLSLPLAAYGPIADAVLEMAGAADVREAARIASRPRRMDRLMPIREIMELVRAGGV